MKRIVLAAWTMAFSTASFAQTKVLTFDDAVRIAMQNSIILNTQRNNLE
jgi:hypothetical protein